MIKSASTKSKNLHLVKNFELPATGNIVGGGGVFRKTKRSNLFHVQTCRSYSGQCYK